MIYRAMEALGVYPPHAVVAVGDTVPDIQAGRNAGVWTVGFAQTGNEVGLSLEEFNALGAAEQQERVARARATLQAAGAHLVVDGIWQLPQAVAALNDQLRQGQKP
jgi:phosphonoacetaldehyde hydrolase